MRFPLVVLLLLTSFGWSGCQSRSPQPPKQTVLSADRVELPTTFIHGVPYVDLQINGKGPYRFMVDTGFGGMGVSTRVAREAGILFSPKEVIKFNGSGGRSEAFPVAMIDRIDCADFSLKGVRAYVLNSKIEDALAKLEGNGGMIGMLPFQDVLLEIDFPRQKVSVARIGSGTPAPAQGIPYREIIPRVTIATPSAKHSSSTAEIDTGSDDCISLNDIVSYPTRVGLTKKDNYDLGIDGYWRSQFGQLAGDIRLGQVIWRDPAISDSRVGTLIGSAALTPWKLVIDQKKKMLWLVGEEKIVTTRLKGPLEPDGRPAVYGYASVWNRDEFLVKEVDSGSRAEHAGLKVGDHILRWITDTSTPGERPEKIPVRDRLQIVRGLEKLEITMSLWEPLPDSRKPAVATPTGSNDGK